MKTLKIIIALLVLLALLAGGAIYYLVNNINRIVEGVIESEGSAALQTRVAVGGVDIQLLEGKGGINSLTIANPKGFSNNDLFTLGNAGIQLDTQTITKPVKVIKNIAIAGVVLRAEQKGISDTNLKTLLDNINEKTSPNAKQGNDNSQTKQDIRLMVESLQFGESKILLETEQYGGRTITLPAYSQSNIGDKQTGLTPEQLSEAIVSNMLRKAEKAVKRELREAAKDKVEEKLKDKLKEELGDKISEDNVNTLKQLFK